MWAHHDAAWWGLVLAIAALVLMLPANILANVLTPRLKNWWAERSVSALRSRIIKLKKVLMFAELHPEMSEVENKILWTLEAMILFLSQMFLFITTIYIPEKAKWYELGVQGQRRFIVILGFVSAFMSLLFSRKVKSFREPRTGKFRTSVANQIMQLTKKLEEAEK